MIFLISLILAAIFVLAAGRGLKKYPILFYIAAVTIAIVVLILTWGRIRFPGWFETWVWPIFSRASFSTALFVVVMVTGALPNGSQAIKTLMPIRGELSIIASILTLGHNASYGLTYFRLLFTAPDRLPWNQLAAAICSIVMIAIMLPLFVTSFKSVRRKMDTARWKKLQRLAYVFYALIYAHVMLLSVPFAVSGRAGYRLNVFLYSGVFLSYFICRILKYAAKRAPDSKTLLKKQLAGVACGVVVAALIIVPVTAAGAAPDILDDPTDPAGSVEASEEIPAADQLPETSASLPPVDQTEPPESASEPPGSEGSSPSASNGPEPTASPTPTVVPTSSPSPSPASTTPPTPTPGSVAAPTPTPSSTAASASTPAPTPTPTPAPAPTPTPTPAPSTVYKNGTFTGSAQGYWDSITVSVTIQNDVITSIIVTRHNEDPEFFTDAQAVIGRILSAQSTRVDTVSGATYSSGGIIDAVAAALASARN